MANEGAKLREFSSKELKRYSPLLEALRSEHAKKRNEINEEYKVLLGRKQSELRILETKIVTLEKKINEFQEKLYKAIKEELISASFDSSAENLSKFKIAKPSKTNSQTSDMIAQALESSVLDYKQLKNQKKTRVLKENEALQAEQRRLLAEAQQEYDEKHIQMRDMLCKAYDESLMKCASNYDIYSHPLESDTLPKRVTIGNVVVPTNDALKEISAAEKLKIPCDVDILKHGNIILKIDSQHNDIFQDRVEDIIVGVMQKYMESFPSGQVKMGIYSSYFSSLPKLGAFFSAVKKGGLSITAEPCSNQPKFAAMLGTVENHCNIISAKLLENYCSDLYALYEKNIKTEAFQFVLVHDVLRDLTEENLRSFCGCITGLHRCGLRFIIVDDFSEEFFKNKSPIFRSTLQQILDSCQIFTVTENGILNEENDEVELVALEKNTTMQTVYDFCTEYCTNASKNRLDFVPYEKVGFGKEIADVDDYESIIIPVGLNDPNVWKIELNCVGRSPIANLVIGIPGTGKSTLIDSMIMNGAMKYSPDEVVFQLLDFKDGISSSVYTMEDCKIPHVKVVSQNNKPEEAEIILSNILAESERRNKEFQRLEHESGVTVKNIAEYNRYIAKNQCGRKNMPRLIIVIDECQYLFEEEALGKKCEDIVRKCRSQGIHLILATQTMSHKMWSTIKFVDGRYCFEIAKDDAEQLLSRKYAATISSDVPKGSYMAYASNNSGQDCEKIRIAYDGGKADKYAKKIREKWSQYPIDIVTIGDKSELLLDEKVFSALLRDSEWRIPLGENYVDHSVICANGENSRPLLVVGSNVDAADHIFSSVIKTAGHLRAETYVVDASRSQALCTLCSNLALPTIRESDENGYLETLLAVHKLYESRKKNIRDQHAPVLFVVNALQNIGAFLNNARLEEKAGESAPTPVMDASMSFADFLASRQSKSDNVQMSINGKEALFNLISNAYKVNIFICMSLDTVSVYADNGEPVFSYQHRNILKMSDYKLLVENVGSDVKNIMEDAFKEKMMADFGPNMAFMSEKQQAFSKFRYFRHF